MRPDCPFCSPDPARIFHSGESVLGLWDAFPVSPGHALLVPRRHVESWFDATREEVGELTAALEIARGIIAGSRSPNGFNIGVNVGAAAGQTVSHLHVHLIPRYAGDVDDPRGGVRAVIPERRVYPILGDEGELLLRDREASWRRTRERKAEPARVDHRAGPFADDSSAASFGERVVQLLDEGRFTATYKYAVLLGLTDLCLEQASIPGASLSLNTHDLAEKIIGLYWPQTAPYPGIGGAQVLVQNRGGQAEIVSAIRRFRERHAADPSDILSRARAHSPKRYEQLVRTVEWKLIEMPLPRFQMIGESESRFLYDIGWDRSMRRADIESGTFDGRIAGHLPELVWGLLFLLHLAPSVGWRAV